MGLRVCNTQYPWMVSYSSYYFKGITYEIPQGFSVAAVSILGCRLVLNLRHAYYYPISNNSQLHQSDMDGILPIQSLPVLGQDDAPDTEDLSNRASGS